MNLELVGALNELERERGISKEILLEAIEAAIVSAYKRGDQAAQNVRVSVSDTTGLIQVFAQKEVVEEVLDPSNEIALHVARSIDPNYAVGDIVEVDVTPKDFGRIAAQTAKQVVIQRIREAERALIFEEYSNRTGDVVTGIVQRSDYRNVLVDLGKVEAILPPSEQIPKENYSHGTRLKVYISDVRQTTKGPQVVVSRSHPGLLKRLFELEVPEIHDGVVEIKAVAREAGNRSKIAVISRDSNVDPVGACVGPRGMRVQTIVQELKGEKIDIVEYSVDPERFIGNALSPARVMRVFVNEDEKSARAVVPDHQLSLAIGREGQNARLAARLTGWKIDIKSETQMAELARLEAARALEPRQEPAPAPEVEAEVDQELEEVAAAPEESVEPVAPAVLEEDVFEQDDVAAEEPIDETPAAAASVVSDDEEPVLEELGSEADLVEDEVDLDLEAEAVLDETTIDPVVEDEVEAEEDPAELDISLDLIEELAEEPLVDDLDAPKPKKSRASKKAEILDILDEDVFDEEDEELPSLFDGDDDELDVDDDEPLVFVVEGSTDDEDDEPEAADEAWDEPDDTTSSGKKKGKLVFKDLSELRSLLDAADRKDKRR